MDDGRNEVDALAQFSGADGAEDKRGFAQPEVTPQRGLVLLHVARCLHKRVDDLDQAGRNREVPDQVEADGLRAGHDQVHLGQGGLDIGLVEVPLDDPGQLVNCTHAGGTARHLQFRQPGKACDRVGIDQGVVVSQQLLPDLTLPMRLAATRQPVSDPVVEPQATAELIWNIGVGKGRELRSERPVAEQQDVESNGRVGLEPSGKCQ